MASGKLQLVNRYDEKLILLTLKYQSVKFGAISTTVVFEVRWFCWEFRYPMKKRGCGGGPSSDEGADTVVL
jgi:hypothetical protein